MTSSSFFISANSVELQVKCSEDSEKWLKVKSELKNLFFRHVANTVLVQEEVSNHKKQKSDLGVFKNIISCQDSL